MLVMLVTRKTISTHPGLCLSIFRKLTHNFYVKTACDALNEALTELHHLRCFVLHSEEHSHLLFSTFNSKSEKRCNFKVQRECSQIRCAFSAFLQFHLNIPEKCIPSFTFYLFYFGVNFLFFVFLSSLSSLSFVVLFFSFLFFLLFSLFLFFFTTYSYFETRENTGSTNFPLQAPVWRIIFSLKI